GGINEDGAGLRHCIKGLVIDRINLILETGEDVTHDAYASSPQTMWIEELPVIGEELSRAGASRRVAWIDSHQCSKHRRCIGNGPPERSHRILAMRNGDNASARSESEGRLDRSDHVYS